MLKSIPALILTVAIALSGIFGVNIAADIAEKHILRSLPEADEIKRISVNYKAEQLAFSWDCNLTNYDELEFLSSRIKQYYENYDEYEGHTSQSTKLVLKSGKQKTYKFDMSHDDQVLLNSITDSNMCIAFLRNALYSDLTVTTYDSEHFPVSTCTTKIAYLDNNGNLCRFTANEELLEVMLSELESMSAFDRASIYNVDSNYSYSNSEKLKQNQYGIMIRIAIDPQTVKVGSNCTYYSFYADAESYPMIHDAIENHIATEYLQN